MPWHQFWTYALQLLFGGLILVFLLGLLGSVYDAVKHQGDRDRRRYDDDERRM